MENKNIGIIGLGQIAQHYIKGLKASKFSLSCLCDTNEEAYSIKMFKNVPFYKNYLDMILKENLKYVIVTTPPKTHYEIVKNCLKNKVNVFLEKPATTNYEQLVELINIAKENGVFLKVVFHWQYGSEVLFLKQYIKSETFYQNYGKLQLIECYLNDPYAKEGKIKKDRIGLEGTWLDAGINMLSLVSLFLNCKCSCLRKYSCEFDKFSNLPKKTIHYCFIDDVDLMFNIDWTLNLNYKRSYFYFDKGSIIVNHTFQRVVDKNNNVIFENDEMERLDNHYYNFFKNFNEDDIDYQQCLKLHELLFKWGPKNEI